MAAQLAASQEGLSSLSKNVIKHETGKLYLSEQMSSLLKNDDKFKELTVIADVCNAFF
jgi:hypothetical protein